MDMHNHFLFSNYRSSYLYYLDINDASNDALTQFTKLLHNCAQMDKMLEWLKNFTGARWALSAISAEEGEYVGERFPTV